jgi:hypothetical protein
MKNTIMIVMLALTIMMSGCTTKTINSENPVGMSCADDRCGVNNTQITEIQKVEVIHFHGTNQCYSCKTVGAYAEETVNTYFANEIKSGKITFAHINAELPENRELAQKYGVTGSSLWLGTYTQGGQFKAEQNVNVWYKINNKEDYLNYLKGIIKQKLAGN